MLTFADLQRRVKEDGTLDQGGSQFDTRVKDKINAALFRISREAPWRVMRRKGSFDTVASYSTGSGAGTFTNDSANITIVGATFITDGVHVGRRIELQGTSKTFTIKEITGETTLVLNQVYDGTTISGTGTYEILPQEEYNLPIQSGHRMFMWHEDYGNPLQLQYITDQSFVSAGVDNSSKGTPTHYRMWGEDMVIQQVLEPTVITIASTSTSDTNIDITVYGDVSGYPDSETIATNSSDGTTSVVGTKSFTSVERVVSSASTTGRITATGNSGNATVAVIPVGDRTAGILYKKVQLYPLPRRVFPVNVYYYKDPYRLVNDGDIHEMGQNFDEIIINLAVAKIKYAANQKEEGDRFFAMYKDELATVRRLNMDKMDWFPKLKNRNQGSSDYLVHKSLGLRQFGGDFGFTTNR